MLAQNSDGEPKSEKIAIDVTTAASVTSNKRDKIDPAVINAVRYLLDRHLLTSGRPLPKAIAVVSPAGGEGVTTVSRAVAEVLSTQNGNNVCWVDVGSSFAGLPNGDFVHGEPPQPPPNQLARGTLPGHRTLAERHVATGDHPNLDDLLERLATEHDFLVFDVPPLLSEGSFLGLLRHADAYLLVARHGSTTVNQLQTITEELCTIPSLGTVLNRYRTRTPRFIRRRFSE